MKSQARLHVSLIFLSLCFAAFSFAGPKDPIDGSAFDDFKKYQNTQLQRALRELLSEDQGYIVVGPLDPRVTSETVAKFYQTVRVICPDIESQESVLEVVSDDANFAIKNSTFYVEEPDKVTFPGYRGILVELDYNREPYTIQFQTLQQLRFLIWAKDKIIMQDNPDLTSPLKDYALVLSQYLYLIDNRDYDAMSPRVADFDLPEEIDIYAPAPDYVIQGYQNYKDYLSSHAEVSTDFTQGVLGFIPTNETLENLKSNAPDIAYPNKEAELFQEELKKYVERGGKMSYMRTMTKDLFDSLEPGEYFFAVGLNGNVRFGRELAREEVAKIEEAGSKPARANHAFLFPGEPILTGGAFFIGCEGPGHLSVVNAKSGHYFYSNITSTIKEDIAERSDSYFITIGHLFNAFDNLGINYDNAVISKL